MKTYIVAAVSFCMGYIIACLLNEMTEQGCKRQPIRITPSVIKIVIRGVLVGAAWPAYLLYVLVSCIALNGEEVGRCLISRKKKKKSITRRQSVFWKKKN